jgi:tetratricopeptide (TPR) repeat protein
MHWQFFKFILANALMYFLMINVFSKKDIPKLLCFILVSHFLVTTYGLLQYLGVDFIKWVSFGEGRVYSTMGNPDYMATQFSILIPVMIALIISPISRINKFLVTIYLCFMFILIIVSHGRGAWVGFLGSLIYMFILFGAAYGRDFFARNRAFAIGVASFVVLLAVIFSFPNPLNKNSQTIIDRLKSGYSLTNNSVAVRLFYWESALQMAMKNPVLGAGIGGFSLNTSYFQRKVLDRWEKAAPLMAAQVEPHVELYTHNDYLQTLAETGFMGLGAYLWLFAAILIMSFRNAFAENNPLLKNILFGISGAIVAFLLNSLLNFPWRVAPTLILLWSLFAVFSLSETKTTHEAASDKFRSWAPALALLFAVIFSATQVNSLLANTCIREGQAAFMNKNYDSARKTFERALGANPRGTDIIELVLYSGNAYNAMGNTPKSIEYYNRGLLMFPNFIESHYNVANVYMNANMTDKAVEEYNKVLDLNPKFTSALNNLANIYFNRNDFDKAVEMYQRALKVKPESVEARYNLGAAYFRMKKYKEAYEELSTALKYDPNYTLAKDWIAKMKAAGLVK